MKKLLSALMAVVCIVACAFGFAACGLEDDNNGNNNDDEKKTVAVESVVLNKSQLTLEIGGEETLIATVTPDDATNKTVTWSVKPTGIVTVTNGKVKAVAEGQATVTATAGGRSATCAVTVNADGPTGEVESVTLNKTTLIMDIDEIEILTATVTPDDATDKTVTWSVAPEGIVAVTDGRVTAIAAGSATITATADGKSATCSVEVNSVDYTPTENLAYALNDDNESYYVKGIGTATSTDIVIPSEYLGKPVTAIGESAFGDNKEITSLILPDSITIIQHSAFFGCNKLKSVKLGNGVTTIGTAAFQICESLVKITAGNSLQTINANAFAFCENLVTITVGNSLQRIGINALYNCKSLSSIYFNGTIEQWKAIDRGYSIGVARYTVHCVDGDIAM